MNFKLPFVLLTIGVIVAGVIPFGMSQQGQIEPSMEIDMLSGQTQNPFRIQDYQNQNVFAITPEGSISPRPTILSTTQFDTTFMDELYPTWVNEEPALVITETSESGVGIYQYTYTITTEDLENSVDSKGMFLKERMYPFIGVQMENIGVGTISMGISVWDAINDVEIQADLTDGSVVAGNFVSMRYGDAYTGDEFDTANLDSYQFEVGDVIGLKIWTDTSGDLRVNHVWIVGVSDWVVDAVSITLKDRHDEVAPFDGELGILSCPLTVPTVCNDSSFIHYSMLEHGDNLESLYGDGGQLIEGSVWYSDLFLGSLVDTNIDQMYTFNIRYFYSYPDSINVVTWR